MAPIASARTLLSALRGGVTAAMDQRFAAGSPIPTLPEAHVRSLRTSTVLLPPLSLMERGNQDLAGLTWLVALARAVDAVTVFEIGSYNGFMALTLAMNLPRATVHTLDLPTGAQPTLPLFQQDRLHIGHARSRVFDGTPEASRIVQHLCDSATFDFAEMRGRCQLVYVDGAHSREYVANDTAAAYMLASDTAVIVWDDYWRAVPDVPAYLDAHRRAGMFRIPGTRLVAWFSDGVLRRPLQYAMEAAS